MPFEALNFGGGKTQDTAVGRVLGGRYRVDGRLGKGGMAVVYRAEDSMLGRSVALKILHHYYAEASYFQKRFKQEARAMASMDHENIVKIYDICQDDVPVIVAEHVNGDDLGVLVSRQRAGRLKEGRTREIAAQLLNALSYAHRRGIIHRDVKPSNVLLTDEGDVKVADFGIARILEEEVAEEPGEIVGSARYMSPEQLRGKESTPRSDIYSVGILLYYCLTGNPPFSGDLKSLVHQQLNEEPKPPRQLNKNISLHMESLILRALAKDPADRHPSARAMLEDLQDQPEMVPHTLGIPRRAIRRKSRAVALVVTMLAALTLVVAGLLVGASGLGYPGRAPESEGRGVLESAERFVGSPTGVFGTRDGAGGESGGPPAELAVVPNVDTYFDYWAEEILIEEGFRVKVVYESRGGYTNRGVTWATEPAMGTSAPKGSTVTIYATPKELEQPKL